MHRPPERRKPPSGKGGSLGTFRSGTAFDSGEDTTLRERQARAICKRFATSLQLALVIADLAYTGRACA